MANVIVSIPDEFMIDYDKNRFAECIDRVMEDLKDYRKTHGYGLSGNYEDETLLMFRDAFAEAEPIHKPMQR